MNARHDGKNGWKFACGECVVFFVFVCGISIWERLSWNFNAGKLSCVDTLGDQICLKLDFAKYISTYIHIYIYDYTCIVMSLVYYGMFESV